MTLHISNKINSMQSFFEYNLPDPDFWLDYKELWDNSLYRPVFQSPHYIQYLTGKYKDDVAIYKCVKDGRLVGAAFFRKDNGIYSFLSDVKNDHNFFVIHKQSTEEEIAAYFTNFLALIKKEKWSVRLKNQPTWASYMDIFTKVGRTSNLYWESSKYAVCPVAEETSPEALRELFNKSKNLRYKMKRMSKQEKAVFEVLTDDEDLENWVEEFSNSHVKKWSTTPTPSAYRSPEKRRLLVDFLRVWIKDEALVRFAINTKNGRIAFCIGLVQENSLVHHSHTYDPDHGRHSPGLALLAFISDWMETQGLNVLDFGYGNEPYKYIYATKELQLNKIFISHQLNLPFILKSKFEKNIRNNQGLIQFYREKIKPLTRGVEA